MDPDDQAKLAVARLRFAHLCANWPDLQGGRYPVKQVIFCNVDSITGLFLTPIIREQFGKTKVQSMHWLRSVPGSTTEPDLDVLLKSEMPVICACWSTERAYRVVPAYEQARGWPVGSVRVYSFGDPYWSTLKATGWRPAGDPHY